MEYDTEKVLGSNGEVFLNLYRVSKEKKIFIERVAVNDFIEYDSEPAFAIVFAEEEIRRLIKEDEKKYKIKNEKLKAWRDKQPKEYRDKENKKRKERRDKEDKYEKQIKSIEKNNNAYEEYQIKKMFREDEELQQKRKEYFAEGFEEVEDIKIDHKLKKKVKRRKEKILEIMVKNKNNKYLLHLAEEFLRLDKENNDIQGMKVFEKNMQDSLICIDELEGEYDERSSYK